MKKLYLIDGVLQMLETPQNDSLYQQEFLAIKELDKFSETEKTYAVKRVVYKALWDSEGYCNWQVIESQYSDNSSIGSYYKQFDDIAEAILQMQEAGFTVTKNGVIIEPLKN